MLFDVRRSYLTYLAHAKIRPSPKVNVGSEFSGIPLNPQHNVTTQRPSPQYGKAEASKMSNTFCWLKFLWIRLSVKICQIRLFEKFQWSRKNASVKNLREKAFVKFLFNKRYHAFYSPPLFRTADLDIVLRVQRDSWKFWTNTDLWARPDFCLSPSSPLLHLMFIISHRSKCNNNTVLCTHISKKKSLYIYTQMFIFVYSYICMYIHICIYIYVDICTYIYTCKNIWL